MPGQGWYSLNSLRDKKNRGEILTNKKKWQSITLEESAKQNISNLK